MFKATRFNWFRAGVSTKIETIPSVDLKTLELLKNMILKWPQERPLTQFLYQLWQNKTLSKEARHVIGAAASCFVSCHQVRAAYNARNESSNMKIDFVLTVEEETHRITDALFEMYPEHMKQAGSFEFISNVYNRWNEIVKSDPDYKEASDLLEFSNKA
ncbi:MAG: hypothetical protein GYB41_15150 [Oceanospirillales bacterium]|nr:hypothetical protein [Oceanospirillales bacterium]